MEEIDIKQIFRAVLKRWWLILLVPLVTSSIAAYVSFFVIDPVYEANATLYVISRQEAQQSTIQYNDMLVGQQLVKDYREIVKSRTVTSQVIEDLDLDMSSKELAEKISVGSKNDTRIIEISVQDTDPDRASIIANKTCEVFMSKVKDLMKVENVEIVDNAISPETPVKPRPLLNIAIGMFLGLFVALGVIFLIEYLDDTIKNSEDVEKYLGLPVLGTIPDLDIK